MYIMNCTWSNIAYVVNKLSRYTINPGVDHWKTLVRVLRYLRYTLYYRLYYTKYLVVLEGYSDANWISNLKDTKYISGYVFTLGGVVIYEKSSKKICITGSTMKSKFIALNKAWEQVE